MLSVSLGYNERSGQGTRQRGEAEITRIAEKPVPVVGIDALRIVAAFMVMVYHLGFKSMASETGFIANVTPGGSWLPAGWSFTWFGWVGVQVFFLISGLVIAFSARSSEGRSGRFLRGRVLRLVPAVVIAALLAMVVEVLVFGMAPGTAIMLGLRTMTFWPVSPWIMGQFWTIGIEIAFYGLVFVLLAAGRLDLGRLAAWLIVLPLLYGVLRMSVDGIVPVGRITALLLFQHGAYFGMGILLSEISRRGWGRWNGVLMLGGVIAAAIQIRVAASWEVSAIGIEWAWPAAFMVFIASLLAAAAALRWNGVIVRRLGPKAAGRMRTLGVMTYPLYLVHNHVGKPVILVALGIGLPVWVAVTLGILVALMASWVIARFLEPPVYRGLARIYDGLAVGICHSRASEPSA